MDEQKNQNDSIFSKTYSSKKAIQILLSLSLLAFISSPYFSQLSSSLSSIKLFTSSSTRSDRPYIFLLCNGIMLLVFKTSGLFAPTGSTSPETEFSPDVTDVRTHVQLLHHQPTDFSENIPVKKNVLSHHRFSTTDFKKNYNNLQINLLPERNAEINTAIMNEVEHVTPTTHNYEEEAANDFLENFDEHEHHHQVQEQVEKEEKPFNISEEEEQRMMLWSTEELNKKCDDFIRKMKHGIKFESQLVMDVC